MAGNLDWLWWTVAAALGASGTALLAWALFWDRARGRLRCPRCWYDMAGTRSLELGGHLSCPECGRSIRSAGALLRTRRRWRVAAAAAFLLLGAGVCGQIPCVQRNGWLTLVPTTAILLAPVDVVGPTFDGLLHDEPGVHHEWVVALNEELQQRVECRPLWGWQDALLGWRVRGCARSIGAVPSSATSLHKRIAEASVEFEAATLTLSALAEEIESQTGIPCRFIPTSEAPDAPTEISAPLGRVSLMAALAEVERSWAKLEHWQYLWTVDRDGIVIGEEGSIGSLPALRPGAVYDLSSVVSWRVERQSSDHRPHWDFLSDECGGIEDVIVRFVSDVLWPEGGGSVARHGRLGHWLLVRATPTMQTRISDILRALRSAEPVAGEAPTPQDISLFDALSDCVVRYDEHSTTLRASLRDVERASFRIHASSASALLEPLPASGYGAGVLSAIDALDLAGKRRWAPPAGPGLGYPSGASSLEWSATVGGIQIDPRMRIVAYDLARLLLADCRRLQAADPMGDLDRSREERVEIITESLLRFVDGRSWPEGGGLAPHQAIGDRLLVAQSVPNHIRISRLLLAMEAADGSELKVDGAAARRLRARKINAPARRVSLEDVQSLATEALGFDGYVDLADFTERLYENPYMILLPSGTCTVEELLDAVHRFFPYLDWEIRPGWWALAPSDAEYLRYWAVYDTTELYSAVMARVRATAERAGSRSTWDPWPWPIDDRVDRHLDLLLHTDRPPGQPPDWDIIPGRLTLLGTTREHELLREWLARSPGDPLIVDDLAQEQ